MNLDARNTFRNRTDTRHLSLLLTTQRWTCTSRSFDAILHREKSVVSSLAPLLFSYNWGGRVGSGLGGPPPGKAVFPVCQTCEERTEPWSDSPAQQHCQYCRPR